MLARPRAALAHATSSRFTNHNAALALLVNTRFFAGSVVPPDVSLVFADPDRVITLLAGTPPYVPRQADWDMAASRCDAGLVAFDDHLGDIRVPIFYVDRTPAKLGTIERTQSTDVTHLVVNPRSIQPCTVTPTSSWRTTRRT